MERIIRRAVGSYTLTATAYDDDGTALTIAGTPTVTITDGNGDAVDSGTPDVASGLLSYALAYGDAPHLDTYTAVWTGTVGGVAQSWTTRFELVGGFIFELSDLREYDATSQLDNTTTYPTAKLKAARIFAEDVIEEAARRAFVPRGKRVYASEPRYVTVNSTTYHRVTVPDVDIRTLCSVTVAGTALTSTELAALVVRDWGAIDNPTAWASGEIVVHYEYGADAAPGPIEEAAMILATDRLVPTATPLRATGESTDYGFIRYSLADGDKRPTGIPKVDAAIAQFGRSRCFIG